MGNTAFRIAGANAHGSPQGREADVEEVLNKWNFSYAIIGDVTEGDTLEFFYHGELVASIPASSLVLGGGAPVYDRNTVNPNTTRR
jgi:phosphoribosylformylglycinamidine synthase